MAFHDDPDSWINSTPERLVDARPYVAALLGKPMEFTTDQDIWEFRLGKTEEDRYRNDPFSDDAYNEWYRNKAKDWKVPE